MLAAEQRRTGRRWARVEVGLAAGMPLLQARPDDQNLDWVGDSEDRG